MDPEKKKKRPRDDADEAKIKKKKEKKEGEKVKKEKKVKKDKTGEEKKKKKQKIAESVVEVPTEAKKSEENGDVKMEIAEAPASPSQCPLEAFGLSAPVIKALKKK